MQTEITNEFDSMAFLPCTQASDINEGILVEEAKSGSLTAFEQLIERYEARVFRLAQRVAYSHEDAEEIMQDAFVKVFKNLSQFRGDSRFYTWLARITINEGLMKMRRHRPSSFSIDNSSDTEEGIPPFEIEDWGPTPEERYSQQELKNILSTTISRLTPRYRVVFHLRDVQGYSTKQTARALDVSQAVVKSRLRRARSKLRDSLGTYF